MPEEALREYWRRHHRWDGGVADRARTV